MEKPLKEYQFYKELQHLPFVEKIVLFGSRARGTNRPKADVDLAIECPSATERDWLKVVDIIDEADTLLEIDCVRLDELSPRDSLRQNILKDAVTLYVKH